MSHTMDRAISVATAKEPGSCGAAAPQLQALDLTLRFTQIHIDLVYRGGVGDEYGKN